MKDRIKQIKKSLMLILQSFGLHGLIGSMMLFSCSETSVSNQETIFGKLIDQSQMDQNQLDQNQLDQNQLDQNQLDQNQLDQNQLDQSKDIYIQDLHIQDLHIQDLNIQDMFMFSDDIDWPDDLYIDSNLDGIDGDLRYALFVDFANGSDQGDGSMFNPFQSISKAILESRQNQSQKFQILISEGDYQETLDITEMIGLYGGYQRSLLDQTWLRTTNLSKINSPSYYGIKVQNVIAKVELQQIHFNATSVSPFSGSSYGAIFVNSSDIDIQKCVFEAIQGRDGLDGLNGRNGTNGSNGSIGEIGVTIDILSNCDSRIGARGGPQVCASENNRGGNGGNGGRRSDMATRGETIGDALGGDAGRFEQCNLATDGGNGQHGINGEIAVSGTSGGSWIYSSI